jgi:hypothetical protein
MRITKQLDFLFYNFFVIFYVISKFKQFIHVRKKINRKGKIALGRIRPTKAHGVGGLNCGLILMRVFLQKQN